MKESKNLIRILHVSYPGIPSGVSKSITKACNQEEDDQDWVGWVHGCDNVGYDMACWREKCDPTLAEAKMYRVVQESARDVANARREKDERDDCVAKVVVGLELSGQC